MIRIVIELEEANMDDEINPVGVGIRARTEPFVAKDQNSTVGMTWIALTDQINTFMRERGVPDFDCRKAMP